MMLVIAQKEADANVEASIGNGGRGEGVLKDRLVASEAMALQLMSAEVGVVE
jgi:hypothetical protein